MGKTNKIKVINKNNTSTVQFDSIKGQTLDLAAVDAIKTNSVHGLLRLNVKEHGNSFKLYYNVTGLISLNQYLRETVLNKRLFGSLLSNVFNIQQELQSAHFRFECLLLNFGKIKVDPASKALYFIYIPIQFYNNETTLKQFLLEIINHATFDQKEDLTYVKEYIEILNKGVNFSLFDLGEYIKTLTEKRPSKQFKYCPNCGREVSHDANNCPYCNTSFHKSKNFGGQKEKFYDPNPAKSDLEVPNGFGKKEQPPTKPIYDDGDYPTGVLGGPLNNPHDEEKMVGFLTRVRTGETVEINKDKFVVGKSANSDFVITGNKYISRSHAIFLRKNNEFFIVDDESLNKTYVNTKEIEPNKEIQIFNNTKIKLSNEEFLFQTKLEKG